MKLLVQTTFSLKNVLNEKEIDKKMWGVYVSMFGGCLEGSSGVRITKGQRADGGRQANTLVLVSALKRCLEEEKEKNEEN